MRALDELVVEEEAVVDDDALAQEVLPLPLRPEAVPREVQDDLIVSLDVSKQRVELPYEGLHLRLVVEEVLDLVELVVLGQDGRERSRVV